MCKWVQNVKLADWVKEQGGPIAAGLILKEKPRTVYAWISGEKAPRIKAAMNIVLRTDGVVDFNGIYGPIAERQFHA